MKASAHNFLIYWGKQPYFSKLFSIINLKKDKNSGFQLTKKTMNILILGLNYWKKHSGNLSKLLFHSVDWGSWEDRRGSDRASGMAEFGRDRGVGPRHEGRARPLQRQDHRVTDGTVRNRERGGTFYFELRFPFYSHIWWLISFCFSKGPTCWPSFLEPSGLFSLWVPWILSNFEFLPRYRSPYLIANSRFFGELWMRVVICSSINYFWRNNGMQNDTVLPQLQTIFWRNRWSGAVPHVTDRIKRSNLEKRESKPCGGGGREKEFLHVVAKLQAKSQKPWKISVLQFWSWDRSFRHGEMRIWLCLYFQHVTRYIGTDFVEESRQNMQRSEKEHFFREGCFYRKEYLSNTADKRCSRQVLQLRCSSWYSIKFYT